MTADAGAVLGLREVVHGGDAGVALETERRHAGALEEPRVHRPVALMAGAAAADLLRRVLEDVRSDDVHVAVGARRRHGHEAEAVGVTLVVDAVAFVAGGRRAAVAVRVWPLERGALRRVA